MMELSKEDIGRLFLIQFLNTLDGRALKSRRRLLLLLTCCKIILNKYKIIKKIKNNINKYSKKFRIQK
jgi:hypothetical protein